NQRTRKMIEATMRSSTQSIALTVNCREGLATTERQLPEPIVTDLAMPEMGGFALADAVHARPGLGHIPTMFVTASVQRGDVARFSEHGAAGYLAKPFSPKALREKIDELIASRPAVR